MVDKIIKLENNIKYILIDEKILSKIKYYVGLKLNEKNEPTNEYLYFEEKKDKNNIFLKPVINDKTKDLLLTSFTVNYFNNVYEEVN